MKIASTLIMLVCAGLASVAANAHNHNDAPPAPKPVAIAIHGGAGTILKSSMTPEKEKAYRDTLQQAVLHGYGVLTSGGTGEQAVVETIQLLEASPLFNAGACYS